MKILSYGHDRKHYLVGTVHEYEAGPIWEILLCDACSSVTLRTATYDERRDDEPPDFEILYPERKRAIRGLPKDIASAYEAALRVRSIDQNAYAVLLGRLLEIVCTEQNATGNTLAERLKDLSDRKIIPDKLAAVAHSIRKLRNVGAHAGSGDLTAEDVSLLDSLSEAVLEYVYIAPQLLARVQERLTVPVG